MVAWCNFATFGWRLPASLRERHAQDARAPDMPPATGKKRPRADASPEADASTSSSGSEADGREAQEQHQAQTGAQPGQALGAAASPQGGGAKDALRAMMREEDSGAFSYDVFEDAFHRVTRVVYHPTPDEDVVFERPEKDDGDDWVLWRLIEKGRLAMRVNEDLLRDLRQVASVVEPYRDEPAPALVVNKHGKVIARADPNNRQHSMPERIHWRLKELPHPLAGKIEGKFFLAIDETIADKHGNQYYPKDEETGSVCATTGFPHAIVFQKKKGRGKTDASLQYVVAACNKVRLVVRLKKWGPEGEAVDASEAEILQMLAAQRTARERHGDLDYEQDCMLYVALEFADGDDHFARVPSSCFVQEPVCGALFAPAESPPYLGGHYEWPMRKGLGVIEFRIAKGVTTSALKKAHKGRQFGFVVRALNQCLCGLEGFTARTRGLFIKGVLHNDASSNERYVMTDGGVVESPKDDYLGKDK